MLVLQFCSILHDVQQNYGMQQEISTGKESYGIGRIIKPISKDGVVTLTCHITYTHTPLAEVQESLEDQRQAELYGEFQSNLDYGVRSCPAGEIHPQDTDIPLYMGVLQTLTWMRQKNSTRHRCPLGEV